MKNIYLVGERTLYYDENYERYHLLDKSLYTDNRTKAFTSNELTLEYQKEFEVRIFQERYKEPLNTYSSIYEDCNLNDFNKLLQIFYVMDKSYDDDYEEWEELFFSGDVDLPDDQMKALALCWSKTVFSWTNISIVDLDEKIEAKEEVIKPAEQYSVKPVLPSRDASGKFMKKENKGFLQRILDEDIPF